MSLRARVFHTLGVAGMLAGLVGCSRFTLFRQNDSSRWTSDDPAAKQMIEMERQWAESGCTHNGIEHTILAEDFQGVAPDGSQYGKREAVEDSDHPKSTERACRMYDVKVHFFGDNLAVLYGSESAIRPAASMPDGKEHTVKLTWVDTWLKRGGKWQIVAAEDMPSEEK
jgi:hypothetical protein